MSDPLFQSILVIAAFGLVVGVVGLCFALRERRESARRSRQPMI
jgi:hypothetical protein